MHHEIAKHKWIESQKAGRDIGMQQAMDDWFECHFPQWVQYHKMHTIELALKLH